MGRLRRCENQAVVIPEDVPFTSVCLVGCGVVTSVGAVLNRARVQPGESVVVIGTGGIGLDVVQGASIAAAGRIIAIDTNPAREAEARRFGAGCTSRAGSSSTGWCRAPTRWSRSRRPSTTSTPASSTAACSRSRARDRRPVDRRLKPMASVLERVRALVPEVSNWGRWGDDDERGTVNLIDTAAVARGASSIVDGTPIPLSIPADFDGPRLMGQPSRLAPLRTLIVHNFAWTGDPSTGELNDDTVTMGLQACTHWDARGSPGLDPDCARWFHQRDVAAYAIDTQNPEPFPPQDDSVFLPFHLLALRDMGMLQGQNWNLEELAVACAADGRITFQLSATPEPFTGASGAPVAIH